MAMTDTAGRNPPVMPPGRELDTLVAEQVMGFPHREWDAETRCAQCGGEMRYCGARAWCYDEHRWRYSPYLEYSTSWDAMGLVVERLVALGWIVEMTQYGEDLESCVQCRKPGGTGYPITVDADTLPHAVCLAALAALKAVEASHG